MAVTKSTRECCRLRQGGLCDHCNKFLADNEGEAHHRYPKSRYKKDDRDEMWNISMLHSECHRYIHDVDYSGLRRLQDKADIEKPPEMRSNVAIKLPKNHPINQIREEDERMKKIAQEYNEQIKKRQKEWNKWRKENPTEYYTKRKEFERLVRKEQYERKKARLKENSIDKR